MTKHIAGVVSGALIIKAARSLLTAAFGVAQIGHGGADEDGGVCVQLGVHYFESVEDTCREYFQKVVENIYPMKIA